MPEEMVTDHWRKVSAPGMSGARGQVKKGGEGKGEEGKVHEEGETAEKRDGARYNIRYKTILCQK
jgi:hypothetical protein